jgi:hypothetical protein
VADDWSIRLFELGHSLRTANASSMQRLFRQFAQESAPGRASALGLDVNGPQQLIR